MKGSAALTEDMWPSPRQAGTYPRSASTVRVPRGHLQAPWGVRAPHPCHLDAVGELVNRSIGDIDYVEVD